MNDQFEGQGGSYVINPDSGARDLLERTAEPGAPPEPPPEEPAKTTKPAKAGFSLSAAVVAPADAPSTTTE